MEIDIDLDSPPANAKDRQVIPADRIAELNEIDKSVTQLLSSASTATAILSGSSAATTREEAEKQFTEASNQYFSVLSSIEVRLRRQVYALEEAGLIPSGTDKDTRRGRSLHAESQLDLTRRAVGGGPLDASWLNARASNNVERGKEAELLKHGRQLLENMAQKNGTAGKAHDDGAD